MYVGNWKRFLKKDSHHYFDEAFFRSIRKKIRFCSMFFSANYGGGTRMGGHYGKDLYNELMEVMVQSEGETVIKRRHFL